MAPLQEDIKALQQASTVPATPSDRESKCSLSELEPQECHEVRCARVRAYVCAAWRVGAACTHMHTCTCMQDPGSPGSVHAHLSDFEHVRAHTHAVPARLTNVPNVSLQRLLMHECDLTSLCRCATRTTVCLRPLARALRPKSYAFNISVEYVHAS